MVFSNKSCILSDHQRTNLRIFFSILERLTSILLPTGYFGELTTSSSKQCLCVLIQIIVNHRIYYTLNLELKYH